MSGYNETNRVNANIKLAYNIMLSEHYTTDKKTMGEIFC